MSDTVMVSLVTSMSAMPACFARSLVKQVMPGISIDPGAGFLGELDGPGEQLFAFRGHLHARQVE